MILGSASGRTVNQVSRQNSPHTNNAKDLSHKDHRHPTGGDPKLKKNESYVLIPTMVNFTPK